ncbi:hypothetical protein GF325_03385, partial [Candidatus Bathyarchaeota archaeon]|nr:hypothetical protein [Candidatus Bathyarchaeota archaeon]
MEGPPVKIVALAIQGFVGQVLLDAGGNAKVNKQQFLHQVCKRIHSIGKNLFFEFKEKSFKLHFLMYGSYRVNEEKSR